MKHPVDISIEELFNEDELRTLAPAVRDMKERGFGNLTLFYKNGFMYHVKGVLDYHNGGNDKKKGRIKNEAYI